MEKPLEKRDNQDRKTVNPKLLGTLVDEFQDAVVRAGAGMAGGTEKPHKRPKGKRLAGEEVEGGWSAPGVNLRQVPPEARQAAAEVLRPVYEELVQNAQGLERATGMTIVNLLCMELADQARLDERLGLDPFKLDLSDSSGVQDPVARYLRLVDVKARATHNLLRLRQLRARWGNTLLPGLRPACPDTPRSSAPVSGPRREPFSSARVSRPRREADRRSPAPAGDLRSEEAARSGDRPQQGAGDLRSDEVARSGDRPQQGPMFFEHFPAEIQAPQSAGATTEAR